MIKDNDYKRIEACLQEQFAVREGELAYYDDLIMLSCLPDGAKPLSTQVALQKAVTELESRLITEVTLNSSITPQAAAYAERLQQAKVTLQRARGEDPILDLALLCFAMSYDMKWIYDAAAHRQQPPEPQPKQPTILEVDIDEDDLPF